MNADSHISQYPLFSIIIPAYNAEHYIDYCLDSVQAQTFIDYEVVVVNDGSTDRTQEICSRYRENNLKIAVIEKQNEGCYRARIEAMKRAKGRYFIFLDSDDLISSNTLQIISEELERNSYPDAIFFGSSSCYEEIFNPTNAQNQGGCISYDLNECKRDILSAKNNTLWGKAIKREVCLSGIQMDTDLEIAHGEDLVQLLSFIDNCSVIYSIQTPLYYYRSNPGSATSRFDQSQLNSLYVLFDILQKNGSEWQLEYCARVGSALHLCSTFKIYWSCRDKTNEVIFVKFCELVSRSGWLLTVSMKDIGLNNYLLLRAIACKSRTCVAALLSIENKLKHLIKDN